MTRKIDQERGSLFWLGLGFSRGDRAVVVGFIEGDRAGCWRGGGGHRFCWEKKLVAGQGLYSSCSPPV